MPKCVLWMVLLSSCWATAGCTPRVKICPAPGPQDTGIRYYRPKPYLLVEPAREVVTNTTRKIVSESTSDQHVQISLEYLPDFSEEYSIHVKSGLGSADVSVTLDQGWNLTALNQNLDSQFDENVKAFAELAEAVSGFVPTDQGGTSGAPPGSLKKWVVPATNVPIGYYESVVGRDKSGKKRLHGWRYVGFMPYATCPLDGCGSESLNCHEVPTPIFGLVFREGVMVFQPLDQGSQHPNLDRRPVSSGEFTVTESTPGKIRNLEKSIRLAVLEAYGVNSRVSLQWSENEDALQIAIDLGNAEIDDDQATLIKRLIVQDDVDEALADLGRPVPEFSPIPGLPAAR